MAPCTRKITYRPSLGAVHVQAIATTLFGPIRIGTRGSPLALAQTREVCRRLIAAHGMPESALETVVIRTSGDRIQDRPLSEVGGKGLFTKEIEDADRKSVV